MEDDIEEAISSIERIHQPNVLAAREALVNASPDTWDLKENTKVYSTHNEYASIIYASISNQSLETVKVDNCMVIYNKKDIIINNVEELKRKLVNNDTLDNSCRIAHESMNDIYDITITFSNNTFAIQYDCYKRFLYKISKNNLIYILHKLIELYYSRN
jgi:hypothetical protein